jgi:hypothetical protein
LRRERLAKVHGEASSLICLSGGRA